MFKTLLKTHREKVENTKKMYEVSLQKLKGAESQVRWQMMYIKFVSVECKMIILFTYSKTS